jgi:transcriptional regulator with XRE-family HTH domain
METIGTKIRTRREQLKMSQAELARTVGVSQASIQKIESGETENSRYIPKLWARLGLPLRELDPIFPEQERDFNPERTPTIRMLALELLRLSMENQDITHAKDALLAVGEHDGAPRAIAIHFIRSDLSVHVVTMTLEVARALSDRLAHQLAEIDDRAPSSPGRSK